MGDLRAAGEGAGVSGFTFGPQEKRDHHPGGPSLDNEYFTADGADENYQTHAVEPVLATRRTRTAGALFKV
jgi:hypothetical protein